MRHADIARHEGVSLRTAQRMSRVARIDPALVHEVWRGAGNWAQAEWLIKNPDAHQQLA